MTDHNKKKILVVDDNKDILELIKNGIEHLNMLYEVTAVSNGKECLNLLQSRYRPDIIFLDIMMPEMNGWEVFTKIKEHSSWNSIPIIFISARADPFSKGFGRIPAVDFIEKPFSISDLKRLIDKYVSV
ncbi:MAG: response regulator [Candidatus Thermoplasmatota archaeon]